MNVQAILGERNSTIFPILRLWTGIITGTITTRKTQYIWPDIYQTKDFDWYLWSMFFFYEILLVIDFFFGTGKIHRTLTITFCCFELYTKTTNEESVRTKGPIMGQATQQTKTWKAAWNQRVLLMGKMRKNNSRSVPNLLKRGLSEFS